jgi:cell division protein DivIC
MGLGATAYHRARLRERRRIPRWMFVLAAGVIATALLGVFGSTFLHVYRLEREASRLAQLQRDLEEQNAQLRAEIKALHTPDYVEKLAREQLGLVKPGETAFLIVQTPAPPPSATADSPGQRPSPSPPGWFAHFWDTVRYLFRR